MLLLFGNSDNKNMSSFLDSSAAEPGSVLLYLPFVSKSMMVPVRPLAAELVRRGHQVTVITDFPFKVWGNCFLFRKDRLT